MREPSDRFAASRIRAQVLEHARRIEVGNHYRLKFPAGEYAGVLTLLAEMVAHGTVLTDEADRQYVAFVCRSVSSLIDRAGVIGPNSLFESQT
jgi:hypothetical protein